MSPANSPSGAAASASAFARARRASVAASGPSLARSVASGNRVRRRSLARFSSGPGARRSNAVAYKSRRSGRWAQNCLLFAS